MNLRRRLALVGAAVSVSLLASAPAVAVSVPPGSTYAWGQPGTAPVTVPFAQPPAWIPIATTIPSPPASGYAWGQPGAAPVSTPFAQPPAWIPIG